MGKAFRPWLRDYRNGSLLLLMAAVTVWISSQMERADMGIALALGPAAAAMWIFKRARRRSYGKALEQNVTGIAIELLTSRGYDVRANVRASSGGDIDMVVRGRDDAEALVEIKAWHHLDYGRKRQLVEQTRRLGKGEQLVLVWLPNAPAPEGLIAWFCDPSCLCDNTYLVKGSVHRLRRALKKLGVRA